MRQESNVEAMLVDKRQENDDKPVQNHEVGSVDVQAKTSREEEKDKLDTSVTQESGGGQENEKTVDYEDLKSMNPKTDKADEIKASDSSVDGFVRSGNEGVKADHDSVRETQDKKPESIAPPPPANVVGEKDKATAAADDNGGDVAAGDGDVDMKVKDEEDLEVPRSGEEETFEKEILPSTVDEKEESASGKDVKKAENAADSATIGGSDGNSKQAKPDVTVPPDMKDSTKMTTNDEKAVNEGATAMPLQQPLNEEIKASEKDDDVSVPERRPSDSAEDTRKQILAAVGTGDISLKTEPSGVPKVDFGNKPVSGTHDKGVKKGNEEEEDVDNEGDGGYDKMAPEGKYKEESNQIVEVKKEEGANPVLSGDKPGLQSNAAASENGNGASREGDRSDRDMEICDSDTIDAPKSEAAKSKSMKGETLGSNSGISTPAAAVSSFLDEKSGQAPRDEDTNEKDVSNVSGEERNAESTEQRDVKASERMSANEKANRAFDGMYATCW